MSAPPPPIVVITGPTASGKSRLAIPLARRLSVPILSLDALKVYRGMDVGTAKPNPERLGSVACRFIDLRDPWESFSVGNYREMLEAEAPGLPRPWLFCGGTAFYLHALIHGIFTGPGGDAGVRASLEADAHRDGAESLHRRLSDLDPEAAAKIHPHDHKRIVRALEVIELSGEPMSLIQARRQPVFPAGSYRLFGIARSRDELYARIDRRVELMFEAGWVEEVEKLMAAHDPPWGKEAAQAIGYTLIREALEGGEDPRQRIPPIQARTHRFARSQLTWFRKMPIEWWAEDEIPTLSDRIERDLEQYAREGTMPTPDPDRAAAE